MKFVIFFFSKNVPVMNPAFTRIHPSRNVIYSCTESVSDNGEIVAWDICPTSGKLSFLSSADAHGTSTCYITIDKARLIKVHQLNTINQILQRKGRLTAHF